ncbi:MAG: SWIM zinc finger family protein, partial [Methylococcales bacterium]|nr:SWIM zinc finger family protein [Methylococcales bacterium]
MASASPSSISLSKKLLNSNIRYECGDSAYERGMQYYEKGRVLDVAVQNQGALFVQLNATVKGSGAIPYKQNIRITWSPGFRATEINGSCTCPIGYNCKHIAAVCMAYQKADTPATKAPSGPNCLDWLSNLNTPVAELPEPYQEFIAYILKPGKTTHELNVEFLITKEKKSGGLGKGRKTTLNNLRYSYNYLNYAQPEDGEIAKLLSALTLSFIGDPILSGATGHIVLIKMLQTGRLFLQDTEHSPLTGGELRELSLAWQALDSDAFQLHVGVEPAAKLIMTEPALYLDVTDGTVGPINMHQLSLVQLNKLLTAPQVPAEYAEEFSLRLTLEHPELPLPPPKKIELRDVDDLTPIPCLTLFGTQISEQHYSHFMQVNFNYGDWQLVGYGPEQQTIVKTDHGLVRIHRDPATEHAAVKLLGNIGFVSVPQPPSANRELILISPGNSAIESATRWSEFLQNTLPELQAQDWVCNVEDSFLLNFQNAQNWDAEISESQNDWFEMRFTVEVNGQLLPLLPLLMPVLEHYDPENLPEFLSIPLADHSYLNLPSDKLKPFLAVLIELFNTSSLDKNGNLKLSRFNIASLADLESHSYGLFSIRGGKELRELAQKIKDFSGIATADLPLNFNATLRNYQQQGLNWLQFLREYQFGGILADDMGLGKT